ncbi:MAG: hypothetical protein GY789_15045 [Hyphomicrobiales bacterium]|nr:hypothetical protein [Hyphomicrobiales bacterium]MCP5002143.1 hypothetical protein [Hyphomicrobiales bacterium]
MSNKDHYRPSLVAVEAAAEVLDAEGRLHGWWQDHIPKYVDLDQIGKEEFDGIVERTLIAAHRAEK